MALKDIDIEAGLRRLADRRIEEAMREGKFSNLKGMGEPMNLDPIPAEENARLTWWALRILRNNDFTPDEVRWRKQIDLLKAELSRAATESAVTTIVQAINELVRRVNTLGTNALSAPVVNVSLDDELLALRTRSEPRITRMNSERIDRDESDHIR